LLDVECGSTSLVVRAANVFLPTFSNNPREREVKLSPTSNDLDAYRRRKIENVRDVVFPPSITITKFSPTLIVVLPIVDAFDET
jgi:hypothetical protein